MIKKEFTISFSSDPDNGALQRSPDGSTFTVKLDDGHLIPESAKYATGEINGARIWNVTPNISSMAMNNTISFITNQGAGDFTITIPNGLYSLTDLGAFISRECVNLGYPSDLVMFGADNSTNKVVIAFPYADTQIDFTQANSCRTVLGFDSRLAPLAPPTVGESESGDTQARFNQINSYSIRGDFISYGIRTNNQDNGVMAMIPITSKPGSQIVFTPTNPQRWDCSDLIGASKDTLVFTLLSDKGVPADTNGEYYSFEVVFRYVVF